MHAPRLRRLAAPIVLAASFAGLVACGGDDGDGASGDPDGFTYEAARLCSDLVNDRDHAVAEAGSDASFAVVEAVLGSEGLDPAAIERMVADMAAYSDLLVEVRERLAEIEPHPAAAREAWDAVVSSGDARIDHLAHRSALLEEVAADGRELDVEEIDLGGGDPDYETLEPALEKLDLIGRDCEVVFTHLGSPEEYATFLDEAASACTTIVSRRRATGFTTDLTLEGVLEAYEDETVTPTPELIDEVNAVAAEWAVTLEDLQAVSTDDVTDADLWQEIIASAAERVDVFERRAAALESGDQAQLLELFTPGGLYTYPGLGDVEQVGLDRRDCRSIAS